MVSCNVCGDRYRSVTKHKGLTHGMCQHCYIARYQDDRKAKASSSELLVLRIEDTARIRRRRREIKLEMIVAYGGRCECCGETEPKFLAIDHIGGGGTSERRSNPALHFNGYGFYSNLKKAGWPKEVYRLLCYNCNMATYLLGCCPHGLAKSRQ